MVQARTQCPDGWTTEYAGYLASAYTGNLAIHQRMSYICLDEAPEVAVGGTDQNQALFYPVEVECGSLPCSVYITGRELTCVVCSKWWIFGRRRDVTLTLSFVSTLSFVVLLQLLRKLIFLKIFYTFQKRREWTSVTLNINILRHWLFIIIIIIIIKVFVVRLLHHERRYIT